MHPAASIIVFSVASGLGFGLAVWLGLGMLWGSGWRLAGEALALALALVGLLASTLHLARPSRAWRAFSQWRSSWLSREGIFAVLALACLTADLGLGLLGMPLRPLGWLAAAFSLLTVHATAMIYAQLRAVPAWHTALTPAVFLAFALGGGALLAASLTALGGLGARLPGALAGAALLLAWALKWRWWKRSLRAQPPSTGRATGLDARGGVRGFEPPHTGRSYLTDEMAFRVARKRAKGVRRVAVSLGAAVPILALLVALAAPVAAPALLPLGAVALVVGLLAERWLFFAEARHVQAAYYGERLLPERR